MSRARHASPSIRRLLAILLGAIGLLVVALFLVTTLQVRRADEQADVENRRTESLRVADGMRQSSNDLTQMVRLYVSTGEPRYREHYDEILAIRSGEAPRPLDYDGVFWDRVLAEGKGFVRYGPPESLVELMRAADFTPAEFDALNSSLRESNDLAQLELDVMARVAPQIARGVDSSYVLNVANEYQLLVDEAYLDDKGRIMGAIDHFIELVDRRTRADVDRAQDESQRLLLVQLGILAAFVVVSLRALLAANRLAIRPLGRLTEATRRIADGDYAGRAEVAGVSELERVADAFNSMATSVEADVAARQLAEEAAIGARHEAEDANRAKSAFLAAMSHEIRTPMIGVTGMLEVLSQTQLTSQQRHMIETAQTSASSLLQIIGDTLDFSKIEAGRLELAETTFDLPAVVDAAVSTFIHTASAKGLGLTSRCDEQLAPALVGDALRVRQILSNFLSNAVKFTEVGGIEVTASLLDSDPERQSVEVAVADTGIGLSEAQRERLFQDFAQADASITQRFGGTGLGLAICRRLAELMGGHVSLDSELGRGTTARLVVPLRVGDAADIVPEPSFTATRFRANRPTPTRDEAIREGSLVLVAEDHSVNRAVLRQQLDIIGFAADTADDGQEALDRFVSGDYSMVISDLNMPRLDGYDLARAIRLHEARAGLPRTPILALTANVMLGEPQRCREAGMDDFAGKPTTLALLAAKLRRWLPHVQLPDEQTDGELAVPERKPSTLTIDPAVLDEVSGGDAQLASMVLRDYIATSRSDLDRLRNGIARGDLDEARREAHRLKGASAAVGATTASALAARLEAGTSAGVASAELLALADELEREVAAVEAELAPELH